jgi:hypothetical protein
MEIAASTDSATDNVRWHGALSKRLRRRAVVRSTATALLLGVFGAALFSAPAAAAAEPPTVTINPTITTVGATAKVSGEIDPGSQSVEAYAEWRLGGSHAGWGEHFVESIAANAGATPISSEITGLMPGETYEFRLDAYFNEELHLNAEPNPMATIPAGPPQVFRQRYNGVTEDQATLVATVVPGGAKTAYYFEYVPASNLEAEGWASSAVVSTPVGGPLPADSAEHEVSATVTSLIPGTRYAWRLVAENSVAKVDDDESYFSTTAPSTLASGACSNEGFRLGPGAPLPDCRAYELASPADKHGNSVEGFAGFFRAPPDGGAVTFYDAEGTPIPSATGGAPSFSSYLASRETESWTTQRLMVPQSYADSKYTSWLGSTSNLRYAIVQGVRTGVGNGLFSIDTRTGAIATIVPWEANPQLILDTPRFAYAFDGASEDGSKVFFETEAALTEGAAEGVDNLYMWERGSGQVALVGLLPAAEGGAAPELGAFGGAYEWYNHEQTGSGGALDGVAVEADHAISENGNQIYFTGGGTGQLYLRRGLASPTPSTVRVSEPAPGAPAEAALPAAFQEATPNGSRAFFLSSQKLTSDATTGPSDEGKDLYRWDAGSGELVDVTPDPEDPAGADVQGLLGISSDGSSGYFVADGLLASGATAGSPNLYRFSETGETFAITFVATLDVKANPSSSNADRRNWSPRTYHENVITFAEEFKTSRVTPDGETLLFSSTASLTGYDNTNPAPAVKCSGTSSPACAEIYLYSATSDRVTCISCDPSGAPPLGPAHLQDKFLITGYVPELAPDVQIPRNLSSDGDRVFFQTPDPLVSRDGNGTSGCPSTNAANNSGNLGVEEDFECGDVYEWEAPGAPGGSCQKAEANGGCLYLLSTGQSGAASYFADASEDGSEAFIITASALVPADRDSVYDVYDVRVDGGMASQWSSPGPECEGEACLGPAVPVPAGANPSSSQFEGPGNVRHRKKHRKQKPKSHRKKHKRRPAKRHRRKAPHVNQRSVETTRRGGSK